MAQLPRYPFSGQAQVALEIISRQKEVNAANYTIEGFDVTSGTSTTFALDAGIAFVTALQVGDGIIVPDTVDVSGDGVKDIYILRDGNPEVVATLASPSKPGCLLYTITVTGGSVAITTDHRQMAPEWLGGLILQGQLVVEGGIDSDGQRITGVGLAVAGTDAVTPDWLAANPQGALSWQSPVLDRHLTAPPGGESTGDRYIVASPATGAWAGQEDNIAEWDGASYDFTTPTNGFVTVVLDEAEPYYFFSGAWGTNGTSAATASKAMRRDSSGRAKVVAPIAALDIANMAYADLKAALTGASFTGQVDGPLFRHDMELKAANFTAAVNKKYFVDHATAATQVIATLPESPVNGDAIQFVMGSNTGGFRVKEDPTDQDPIRFHGSASVGDGTGYWERTSEYGAITVVYSTDDSEWHVTHSQAQWLSDSSEAQHALNAGVPFAVEDGVGSKDAVAFGQLGVDTIPKYSQIDVTAVAPTGDLIAEGFCIPSTPGAGSNNYGFIPGAIGISGGGTVLVAYPLHAFSSGASREPYPVAPGFKAFVKGMFVADNDAPSDTGSFRFGVGIAKHNTADGVNVFSETESTRDDDDGVFVYVDDSENVLYANFGANASTTDSGEDVDLTAGMYFEIEVEHPTGATNFNEALVTIKINGVTILDEEVPTHSGNQSPAIVLGLNMRGHVSKLSYKVEKAA